LRTKLRPEGTVGLLHKATGLTDGVTNLCADVVPQRGCARRGERLHLHGGITGGQGHGRDRTRLLINLHLYINALEGRDKQSAQVDATHSIGEIHIGNVVRSLIHTSS
jgi:hypothetical protein